MLGKNHATNADQRDAACKFCTPAHDVADDTAELAFDRSKVLVIK